jgi:NADH-quinone oxidoreductase subunit G
MPTIVINGKTNLVPEGITVIQACEISDVEIPRFCYHERLAIAGNCRMCLVEIEGMPPKPVASCAMPVAEGMKIHTDTPMVKKAREGVMGFLLANHPLDCPICDQGGECDLQDQAYQYGSGKSQYHEHKRAVKDKNMGPLIKTQMTRCIQCTRCVRFIEDVAGTAEIGAVNRGENMEITTYLEQSIRSELSGNIIDLCPVGALTSKPYAFKARSWELRKMQSVDVMDATGSNIRIDVRGIEVMRILPRLNEEINEEWISDKTRFCYDGLKYQRLTKAYVKDEGKLKPADFDEALEQVAKKIKSLHSHEIAAFSGQLSACEEIFALKRLLEKLGVKNFDCRLKGEKLNPQDRSSYIFNTTIAGVELADACLIIGANLKKDAPVLNARIRKSFLAKKLNIAALGCNEDLTYNCNNLGNDAELLKDLLDDRSEFCQVLKQAVRPMLILGHDMIARKDGDLILTYAKKIAEKFNMIKDDWRGFNFLSKSTGLLNGLETGFTGSSNVAEILQKAEKSEIKMMFLHAVDDDIDFTKLKNVFVVYIGSHGDRGAKTADVILPAAAYSEKDATYINIEGRPQRANQALFAPGKAVQDHDIILKLAQKLAIDLGFKNLSELRKEMALAYPVFFSPEKLSRISWTKSDEIKDEFCSRELLAENFDFYLTNPIARASRTLNRCSIELAGG